jgi:predicted GNAT family N-acyltransferase
MSQFISFLPPPGLALANYDSAALHTTQPQDVPEIFRDAMSVREDVFVKEQNIALENEVDMDDARSFHWVAYASVGTTSGDGNAAMDGVNKDSATSAEKTGRKGSTAIGLPVGTIRLVPPPHPPHPEPGSSHKIDNHEGLPKDMQSGLSKTEMHDGKEAYIKLGRLSVLQPFRGNTSHWFCSRDILTFLSEGLGLARLLIDAALTWASENVDEILPPMSPAAAEQRKLEFGGGADVEDVWRGLVLVHAQAHLEKYWALFGFVKDESMGTWEEENIMHVGMWKRVELSAESPTMRKMSVVA